MDCLPSAADERVVDGSGEELMDFDIDLNDGAIEVPRGVADATDGCSSVNERIGALGAGHEVVLKEGPAAEAALYDENDAKPMDDDEYSSVKTALGQDEPDAPNSNVGEPDRLTTLGNEHSRSDGKSMDDDECSSVNTTFGQDEPGAPDPNVGEPEKLTPFAGEHARERFTFIARHLDYSYAAQVDYCVAKVPETDKLDKCVLHNAISHFAAHALERPRICHLWIKDIVEDDLIGFITKMVSAEVPSPRRRTLLRLETRDAYSCLTPLALELLRLRKVIPTLSVKVGKLYASHRDPANPRSMIRGEGSINWFVKHEQSMQAINVDYMIVFTLQRSDEPSLSVVIYYNDRVVTRNMVARRHQYIAVDQQFADSVVSFDLNSGREFSFDIECPEEELVPVSSAYEPIHALPHLLNIFANSPHLTLKNPTVKQAEF